MTRIWSSCVGEKNMKEFNRGGFKRNFGPQKKYKAICTDCGKECEVPFEPSPGKDVRCIECHKKHKGY